MKYKLEKEFKIDEFICLVVGISLGHRCGYVVLPKNHRLEKCFYDEIVLHPHGGLTYSTYGVIDSYENNWVIGFDCAHFADAKDVELMIELGVPSYDITRIKEFSKGTIKTTDFVEVQLRQMVKDIMELSIEK